jgi:hypothetical protein
MSLPKLHFVREVSPGHPDKLQHPPHTLGLYAALRFSTPHSACDIPLTLLTDLARYLSPQPGWELLEGFVTAVSQGLQYCYHIVSARKTD